jgi:hypothetical protein
MSRRKRLGWVLTALGLVLIAAALVILLMPSDLGVRVAVAVSLPGGLLGVLGAVLLLAEGEWLTSGAGEDARDIKPPRIPADLDGPAEG